MILVLNKGVKRLKCETGGNFDPHVDKSSFCFLYPFFFTLSYLMTISCEGGESRLVVDRWTKS